MTPRSSVLAPLRHPAFRRAWLGQLANGVGDAMFVVALSLMVIQRQAAASSLGTVLGAQTLGYVLVLLFGGVFADRHRRSRVIIASDLLRAAAVSALILLGADAPLAALAACAFAVGAGSAIYRPAYGALLPSLVPEEAIASGNALRSLTNRLAGVLGPAVGGLLVAAGGVSLTLGVDVATFVVSILTLVRLPDPFEVTNVKESEGLVTAAWEGVKIVLARPWIASVIAQGAVQMGFVVAPATILLPIVLKRLDAEPAFGPLLAVEAVGAILGALAGARVAPRRPGVIAMFALLLQGPQLVALGYSAPLPLLALGMALAGFGLSVFAVLWTSALQTRVPRTYVGRVLSLDALGTSAIEPLGLACAGWLVGALGFSTTSIVAFAVLVGSVVSVIVVPGVRTFSDAVSGGVLRRRPWASWRQPAEF